MKMYLEILLLVLAIAVLIYILFQFAQTIHSPEHPENLIGSVCFKENCFEVELAVTSQQRQRGLMHRQELGEGKGMLFIFEKESFQSFWMKDTLIPLDIIWMDSNKKIIFISKNAQPCERLICESVGSAGNTKYVLELKAGVCDKIGLQVGDTAEITLGE